MILRLGKAGSIPACVRSVPGHAAPPEPHKSFREKEKSQELKPGEWSQFFNRIVH